MTYQLIKLHPSRLLTLKKRTYRRINLRNEMYIMIYFFIITRKSVDCKKKRLKFTVFLSHDPFHIVGDNLFIARIRSIPQLTVRFCIFKRLIIGVVGVAAGLFHFIVPFTGLTVSHSYIYFPDNVCYYWRNSQSFMLGVKSTRVKELIYELTTFIPSVSIKATPNN